MSWNTRPIKGLALLFLVGCTSALTIGVPTHRQDILEPPAVVGIKPDDPYFAAQTYIKNCKIDQAWQLTSGSKSIRVGIIDDAVDYTHPDLNIVELTGSLTYSKNHGTPIAGIISAKRNNGRGIAGITNSTTISFPEMRTDGYSAAEVSQGLKQAVQAKCNVVNCSFGTEIMSTDFYQNFRQANMLNTVIVASAMNDGSILPYYPASFPGVISVGSISDTNRVSIFSNRWIGVSLYAPGEDLYSTWNYGNYGHNSGTSFSTPIVTGVVSLMLSVNPSLTPAEVKDILIRTAETRYSTYRKLDAYSAVYNAKHWKRK